MERFSEIWSSIRTNLLRTFLTGFSVAWGIFMLVILLGVGTGLQNGTRDQFKDDAINSIWINPGKTSRMHNGLQPGRNIQLYTEDYDLIKREIAGIDKITARKENWQGSTVRYGSKVSSYRTRGVHPDHQFVEKTIMIEGRYINEADQQERRKICVIGSKIEEDIFEGKSAIGEWISVGGVVFKVVGKFKDEGSEGENSLIYIPLNTMNLAFGHGTQIDKLIFSTGDANLAETQAMASKVRKLLAHKYNFSEEDNRALYVRNNFEEFKRLSDILELMKSFFWLIGILTIFAGIVGVSNIMVITVQERTKEIGIRKSLGAKPWSIIGMILQEAIFITGFFGYFGLFAGVFILELVSKYMPEDGAVFSKPQVDFNSAIAALVVLIVAGALAALVPARRAASIRPVEALKAD